MCDFFFFFFNFCILLSGLQIYYQYSKFIYCRLINSHVSILIDSLKCLILLFSIYIYVLVQKRSAEGGKQGSSIKKLKKDKVVGAAGKTARPEANAVSMAPRVKPELALPVMYFPNPCFILSPSIYILMAYGCTLLMLLELMRIRNQVVEVLT